MKKNLTAAVRIFSGIGGAYILFGILYLVTPRIMPYHERILGMTHEQLEMANQKFAFLAIQSLRIIGALCCANGIGIILMARKELRAGNHGIRWIILSMLLIGLAPILKATLSMGLHTPWWAVAALIILGIIGFVLAGPDKTAGGQ